MAESINIRSVIGVLILVVIATALVPTIATSCAAAAACLTGAAAIMVNLVPLFYVIGIILALVTWATKAAK